MKPPQCHFNNPPRIPPSSTAEWLPFHWGPFMLKAHRLYTLQWFVHSFTRTQMGRSANRHCWKLPMWRQPSIYENTWISLDAFPPLTTIFVLSVFWITCQRFLNSGWFIYCTAEQRLLNGFISSVISLLTCLDVALTVWVVFAVAVVFLFIWLYMGTYDWLN